MAYPTTYTAWIDYLKDMIDVEDLTDAQIGISLDLAQTRLQRELNSQYMEATLPIVVASATLPIDLAAEAPLFDRMILLASSQNGLPLEAVPFDQYQKMYGEAYWDGSTPVDFPATPLFYSIAAQQLYTFAPAAVDSTLTLTYYTKVPHLETTAQETNVFSINHPDLLTFAACVEISGFIVEDERIPVWQGRYADALAKANENAKDSKLGSTPLRRRVTMYQTSGSNVWPWGWN